MAFIDFVKKNKWCITLVAIGVITVLLIFTINFWRTLLIGVVVALCIFFGRMLDKNGKEGVKGFFDDLFKKRQ
ncbi:MAG: DUF2273 domain-containing protein [Eubacteriales bacterium]|nr:DUF2273 domain-containing protein [Eubacteriales bacterium]